MSRGIAMTKAGMFFVVFLTTLCVSVSETFYQDECDPIPENWCDSVETATKCGVYEQCSKYVWHKNDLHVEAGLAEDDDLLATDAPPVKIDVYYESMRSLFVAHMLYNAWYKIGQIMEVTLVPFGNAKEKKVGGHWEFTCRDGPQQCQADIIEACSIDIMKNISQYLPYVACIEGRNKETNATERARKCGKEFPAVPLEEILKCSTSSKGNNLMHQMGVKTVKHDYIPWIVINGKHDDQQQVVAMSNLQILVCKLYTGTKPKLCSE